MNKNLIEEIECTMKICLDCLDYLDCLKQFTELSTENYTLRAEVLNLRKELRKKKRAIRVRK
jgi:hypothetical protein